ncbi:MAG: hypothetical protein ACMXYA_01215 [Candidatus Woesearchaeota archaeon]
MGDGSSIDDFCVMKYDAKNVGGVAVSQPGGIPWNFQNNMTGSQVEQLCIDAGFELMTTKQWMTIGENILNTPINNLDLTSTNFSLSKGFVDDSASIDGFIPSISDSGTENCDISVSLDHPANNNCPLRIEGYYGTGSSWEDGFGSGRENLRTFVLTNGEVIWDISGNADNFVKFETPSISGPSGDYYYVNYHGQLSNSNCHGLGFEPPGTCYNYILSFFPYLEPSHLNVDNIGPFGGDLANFNGFGKAGGGLGPQWAGVFSLDHVGVFWGLGYNDGFRCTYTP